MALQRIIIENVRPRTPTNDYPAKSVAGETVRVTADIYREGHDVLDAAVRWRGPSDKRWRLERLTDLGNDAWETTIQPSEIGLHRFVVEAWTDHFETWRRYLLRKHEAGLEIDTELEEGALLLEKYKVPAGKSKVLEKAIATLRDRSLHPDDRLAPANDFDVERITDAHPYHDDLSKSATHFLRVDRRHSLVGAWYEFFPRSEGGFEGAIERLPAIVEMGFDIVYLPPIHPIGKSFRKGRDNTLTAKDSDPGSPWAIGSDEGGHTAIHSDLGDFSDFDRFIKEAESAGLEVAIDYALQCSPDHPWVKEHPEWFHHRPDGTIKYAENPPKRYQDIYPINFWPETGREELWQACKEILEFWIGRGIRIFRVDNPHTKPFAFWEWMLSDLQDRYPDTIVLAEAFTRPKVMSKLAEVGFNQSYTYFTWRRTKQELTEYLTEVALTEKADYMRPNFWPNTPDILSDPLRGGGPGAFKMRFALAATMSPSYGIYSGYELCENEPASPDNEEYLNSEKFEIRSRVWDDPDSIASFITKINAARRRHPALQELRNIRFQHSSNERVIAFSKRTDEPSDVVLTVVNLDPDSVHETTLWLDLNQLGLPEDETYEAHDEITDTTFVWSGPSPYVRLEPTDPVHLLHLRRRGAVISEPFS